MKKKLLMVLSTAVVAASIVVTTSANDDISILVNGETIECDQAPVIVDGRTLVPVRAIAETVGAEVDWDGETKTATVDTAVATVALTIGSDQMVLTNKATSVEASATIDVPAQIINGRTMLPIRAISESLGLEVDWDAENRDVIITVPGFEPATEITTEEVSEEASEETTEEATEAETEEVTEEATEEATEEVTEEATEAEEETEAETEEVTEEATEAETEAE